MFRDNKLAAQEKEWADLKERYEAERTQRLELEKKLEKYASRPKEPSLMVRRGLWLVGGFVSIVQAIISIPFFFFHMFVGILGEWIIPVILALVVFFTIVTIEHTTNQPQFRPTHYHVVSP